MVEKGQNASLEDLVNFLGAVVRRSTADGSTRDLPIDSKGQQALTELETMAFRYSHLDRYGREVQETFVEEMLGITVKGSTIERIQSTALELHGDEQGVVLHNLRFNHSALEELWCHVEMAYSSTDFQLLYADAMLGPKKLLPVFPSMPSVAKVEEYTLGRVVERDFVHAIVTTGVTEEDASLLVRGAFLELLRTAKKEQDSMSTSELKQAIGDYAMRTMLTAVGTLKDDALETKNRMARFGKSVLYGIPRLAIQGALTLYAGAVSEERRDKLVSLFDGIISPQVSLGVYTTASAIGYALLGDFVQSHYGRTASVDSLSMFGIVGSVLEFGLRHSKFIPSGRGILSFPFEVFTGRIVDAMTDLPQMYLPEKTPWERLGIRFLEYHRRLKDSSRESRIKLLP